MYSNVWAIEQELLTSNTVIGQQRTAPANADQELMTFAMRVFAACFHTWYVKHHEVPFHSEWNATFKFTNRKVSANVLELLAIRCTWTPRTSDDGIMSLTGAVRTASAGAAPT